MAMCWVCDLGALVAASLAEVRGAPVQVAVAVAVRVGEAREKSERRRNKRGKPCAEAALSDAAACPALAGARRAAAGLLPWHCLWPRRAALHGMGREGWQGSRGVTCSLARTLDLLSKLVGIVTQRLGSKPNPGRSPCKPGGVGDSYPHRRHGTPWRHPR